MKFNNVAGTLPEFNTLRAAVAFVGGYLVPRCIVQHCGKFYVCAPSTARRYGKRPVRSNGR